MTRGTTVAAIVLAAGRSVRFRSSRSKLAHPLAGRPLIQWALESLRAARVDPVVVVVGSDARELRQACGSGVRHAVQSEPRGTGHAVLAAERALRGFSGNLIVLNADLPLLRAETIRALIDRQRATGGGLTLLTAQVADPGGWGRIIRAGGAVRAIVEERDADEEQCAVREVNVGVYGVDKALLFSLLREVRPDNAQGEVYLTDIIGGAVGRGVRIAHVTADPEEAGQVNSREELAEMERAVRRQINAKWMAAGVTLEDPDTAYIGPDVTIGRDTVIGPNVHLRGRTSVGESCCLDGSAFLTDATLGDRVHIRFGVVMTETAVGKHCQVGPFAHLRPGSKLADEVHIGDFVETKKAIIGKGTKANHLAYLGDVEIGSEANIGAGTITCNYDGFRKHLTVVGDRVQVGSDTQLVAPVTLGDDVYVASGSTVRRNVPAGALVFNPRQQAERPGWVAARRAREAVAGGPEPARKRAPRKARKAEPVSKTTAQRRAKRRR